MKFPIRALSDKFGLPNLSDRGFAAFCLLATGIWIFPQTSVAQSVQSPTTPKLAFEINEKQKLFNYIDATLSLNVVQQQKVRVLKDYLAERDSPLVDHADVLMAQPNWKVVLAISHAESNMCKHQLGNNCWGIGGAEYHRFYPSFAEGIVDANNLVQKYADSGLDTPNKMMRRWVGWNNPSWVVATKQVLYQLDQLGI